MTPIENLKLSQFIVGEPHGGAERFFVKLAIALHEAGLQQSIFIGKDKERFEELSDAGLMVDQFNFRKGPLGLLDTRNFQRALAKSHPDIVLAWMNRAARRVPAGPYKRVARFGGYYPLKYYAGFDHIICNTPDLARHVCEGGWNQDQVSVISNFGELPEAAPVNRREFDTKEDTFVILASGRFHHSKGFDTLLQALVHVPDAVLWLAGAGEEEDALRAMVTQLVLDDRVRFLGWRHDQASLLEHADICAIPSRHEPLSNVLVEAWSKRVPVVATASEGPSWLLEDGTSGVLTPVDDTQKLANAINLLVSDKELRSKYSIDGFRKWERNFSRRAIIDQYVNLFQKMTR